MRITIIGAGNMGGALARGWHAAGLDKLTVTARTNETLERLQGDCPGISTTTDNAEAVSRADIVVLAVKPWLVEQVVKEIRPRLDLEKQTIVSVAANIGTCQLRQWLECDNARVAYAMPNIAAQYGQSMTFVTCDSVADLFRRVGQVMVVEERLIAPGMAMAGCGIAYVMRFIRAMQEGGVQMGLYPQQAKDIALQAIQGAVTLLQQTGLHPEAAIDRVTTPGGLTIKGLNAMEKAGFTNAVIEGLLASAQKK